MENRTSIWGWTVGCQHVCACAECTHLILQLISFQINAKAQCMPIFSLLMPFMVHCMGRNIAGPIPDLHGSWQQIPPVVSNKLPQSAHADHSYVTSIWLHYIILNASWGCLGFEAVYPLQSSCLQLILHHPLPTPSPDPSVYHCTIKRLALEWPEDGLMTSRSSRGSGAIGPGGSITRCINDHWSSS